MANDLRVGITADTSGLDSGLSAAEAKVLSSAQTMAQAQQAAAAATKNLAEAQAQLGASAATGNAQAQQILAQYRAEVSSTTAALVELTSVTEANAAAMEMDAAATGSAAAATNVLGISSRQAATAGIGILEGRMMSGNRAAAAFLSTTLGLGPALQAAFPVIGALALGEVLVQIVKGIVNFSEKASELATELNTDWLTGAIGQMTGLAKATEEADKQIEKFAKDNDEAKQKIASAAVEQARLNAELATPGPKGAQQGAIAADNVRAQQIQQRINALEREKELATQAAEAYGKNAETQSAPEKPGVTLSKGDIAEQRKLQEQAIAEYKSAELEQTSLIAEKENLILQAEVARAKVEKPKADRLPGEIAKQQIEAAHAMDSALNPAQQITAELQKHLELDVEAERSSKEGTAAERERLSLLQDQTALGKANADLDKLAHEEITTFFNEQNKIQEEATKKQAEDERKAAEDYKRDREEQIALAREQAQETIKAAQETFEFTEREIRYESELGIISARVAAQRLAAASQLKQQQTTGALSQEQGLFDPALGEKQLAEYTKLENQMTQEARKGALEREQITQQETLKIISLYKRVSQEFNTDMQRAMDEWITKSQTAGQAFGKMFGQMELQLINFIAEWILKKAEMWALDEALQVSGLAKQKVTQGAAAVAQVASDAAVAAAGTMAYYSAINPPAAPALAAAAYAETMAYTAGAATFDTGGMLPHMGLAFNQSGSAERILSPSQTANFDSMVNNGGSRSTTLNQTNNFGGGVTPEMLQAHTQQTMASMRRMIRPEALA